MQFFMIKSPPQVTDSRKMENTLDNTLTLFDFIYILISSKMFQVVFSFIFMFCFMWKFAKTKQKKIISSHTWVSLLPTRPSVTHRSFLFPNLHESTPVAPSVGGCEPVDAAPIDGILPSLSAAQQMAGGLGSPDIHHCLAVRCSRSSALTSRPFPRTSLPPPLRGPPV